MPAWDGICTRFFCTGPDEDVPLTGPKDAAFRHYCSCYPGGKPTYNIRLKKEDREHGVWAWGDLVLRRPISRVSLFSCTPPLWLFL